MTHRHQWRTAGYLLLELPTHEGFADRSMTWQCRTCSVWAEVDGHVRLGTPVATPEFWDTLRAQEQRQATPEARQARQTQRRRPG